MPAALALPRAQFLHQLVTVFPRQADVGDENVRPPFVAGGQSLSCGDRGPHFRAALREHHAYNLTRIGFAIHKQCAHTRKRGRIFRRQSSTRRIVAQLFVKGKLLRGGALIEILRRAITNSKAGRVVVHDGRLAQSTVLIFLSSYEPVNE
jgi:hypothetical protein